MSFGNPVVAGGILQVPAIESLGYIAGLAGWIIERNGDAEFNNLVIRGKFEGTDFEITSAGVFFYSATPANGNLVISLAYVGGTDPYGNGYPAGLQILNHGGVNASGIAIGYAGTQPLMYFLNAVANMQNDPAFLVNTSGAGTAEFASFVISGGEDATQKDYVAISFDSSSADGTSHIAQIQDAYVDSLGASHPLILRGIGGTIIYAGSITAVQPGTGTSRANLAVAETWHTPGSISALWTTTGAAQPVRYRFQPDGTVRLSGELLTTGAGPWPANATLFTLGSGYAPVQSTPFVTRSDIAVAAGQCTVNVLNSGGVQNGQPFTAAGQRLWFDGITFPTS